jgi:hypothetical protein
MIGVFHLALHSAPTPAPTSTPAPTQPPPLDANYLTLLGSLYTCLSVIVVFQMFALQVWLQDAQELARVAWETDRQVTARSLERRAVLERIANQRQAFPSTQVIFLGGALIAICILALILATSIQSLNFLFTGSPTMILLVVFAGTTLTIWRKGVGILEKARRQLEPTGIGSGATS